MKLWWSLSVLIFTASSARLFQDGSQPAAPPTAVEHESIRAATLRRDPRTLPRAPEDRWKTFGETPLRAEDVPPGMHTARKALLEDDLPAALTALYALLESQPDYPPALHQMGVIFFRLQRYLDAVEVFERFVRHVPRKVGETRTLGHCYYSLGDYAKARAHYERVLAQAPEEIEAVRGLALSYMRLGDGTKALELLAQVVHVDPNHADAWAWQAQILFDAGRSDEALAAAARARDIEPHEPRNWFLLGRILLELGREDEGRAAQARYSELQEIAQEIRSVETRLEYRPHQLPLLLRLVELHRKSGDVPRTRTALARVLAERPADVDLRIFTLDVLEDMGDADGARVAARTLETVCRDDAAAWKRLEAYYARLKDLQSQLRAGERYRRLKAQ